MAIRSAARRTRCGRARTRLWPRAGDPWAVFCRAFAAIGGGVLGAGRRRVCARLCFIPKSFCRTLPPVANWATLWLVPNPPQHPGGDFGLAAPVPAVVLPRAWRWRSHSRATATYPPSRCTAAPCLSHLIARYPQGNPAGLCALLAPLLRQAMAQGAHQRPGL